MSKSTACNLEEVMRGLSISSPSPLVGGELAPSFQETVDDVFVDGGVAETCQRGKDDTLDQRELLDSTDALLMDATNKMDDTAFLDEVIARQCRSYGSTDDDYIDEVIARCSCLVAYNCFELQQIFEGPSNGPWRTCWMGIMETLMAQGFMNLN